MIKLLSTLVLMLLLSFTNVHAETDIQSTVALVGRLLEVRAVAQCADDFNITAAAGRFDEYRYVDVGTEWVSGSFTAGIGVAYLPRFPEQYLTGHFQFKITASYAFNRYVAGKYIHFSNGQQLFDHHKRPNYGRDFVGLQFTF